MKLSPKRFGQPVIATLMLMSLILTACGGENPTATTAPAAATNTTAAAPAEATNTTAAMPAATNTAPAAAATSAPATGGFQPAAPLNGDVKGSVNIWHF